MAEVHLYSASIVTSRYGELGSEAEKLRRHLARWNKKPPTGFEGIEIVGMRTIIGVVKQIGSKDLSDQADERAKEEVTKALVMAFGESDVDKTSDIAPRVSEARKLVEGLENRLSEFFEKMTSVPWPTSEETIGICNLLARFDILKGETARLEQIAPEQIPAHLRNGSKPVRAVA